MGTEYNSSTGQWAPELRIQFHRMQNGKINSSPLPKMERFCSLFQTCAAATYLSWLWLLQDPSMNQLNRIYKKKWRLSSELRKWDKHRGQQKGRGTSKEPGEAADGGQEMREVGPPPPRATRATTLSQAQAPAGPASAPASHSAKDHRDQSHQRM